MARVILAGSALAAWLAVTSFPFGREPPGGADSAPAGSARPNQRSAPAGGAHPALLGRLLARWEKFAKRMDEGERQVQLGRWKEGRRAFEEALALIPGSHRAAGRLALCKRRLAPDLPGFTAVGPAFDPQTGLAR